MLIFVRGYTFHPAEPKRLHRSIRNFAELKKSLISHDLTNFVKIAWRLSPRQRVCRLQRDFSPFFRTSIHAFHAAPSVETRKIGLHAWINRCGLSHRSNEPDAVYIINAYLAVLKESAKPPKVRTTIEGYTFQHKHFPVYSGVASTFTALIILTLLLSKSKALQFQNSYLYICVIDTLLTCSRKHCARNQPIDWNYACGINNWCIFSGFCWLSEKTRHVPPLKSSVRRFRRHVSDGSSSRSTASGC